MDKKLERDTENNWLGGVCSGLGNYFNIDANLIRLAFIIAFIGWGVGIVAYIILWILMPEK